jgi:hypothetical protein
MNKKRRIGWRSSQKEVDEKSKLLGCRWYRGGRGAETGNFQRSVPGENAPRASRKFAWRPAAKGWEPRKGISSLISERGSCDVRRRVPNDSLAAVYTTRSSEGS